MKVNVFRGGLIVLSLLVLASVLTLSPAQAEERAGRCLSFQTDLTSPSIAKFLSQQILVPTAPARTVMLRNGQKVSSQSFAVGGLNKAAGVTVSCSSTCNGNGCSINGCDASSSGCSSCSCFGIGCSSCSCTKTSTWSELPGTPGPGSGGSGR